MINVKIGDAFNLMRSVSDKEYDLILTDPPYNLGLDYGMMTNDRRDDYKDWSKEWFNEAKRISKSIIFTPGFDNLKMWITEIEYPKGIAVLYAPNQCCHSNLGGFNHYEPILVYGKINLGYNVFKMIIKMQTDTGEHPCPKQKESFKDILLACNPKPVNVLDPFAGSGTTLRACRELNINCMGFEINPKYERIIKGRALLNVPSLDAYVSDNEQSHETPDYQVRGMNGTGTSCCGTQRRMRK